MIDFDLWRTAIRNDTFSRYHYAMGVALEVEGSVSHAEAAYRRAVDIMPDLWTASLRLVNLLRRTGRSDEAETIDTDARRRYPRYAVVAGEEIGYGLVREDKEAEAYPWFEAALREDPDLPIARVCFALKRLEDDDIAAAEEIFAGVRPVPVEDAAGLGNVLDRIISRLYQTKSLRHVLAARRGALRIIPLHAPALVSLGNLVQTMGDMDRAVACFSAAVVADPAHDEAYARLVAAADLNGEARVSARAVHHGVALAPNSALMNAAHGTHLVGDLRFEEAEAAFRRSIASNSLVWGVHYQLGIALLVQGRPREAEAAWETARSLGMDPTLHGVMRVRASLARERVEEARLRVRDMSGEGSSSPFGIHVANLLGEVLYIQGRVAEAEAAFRRVVLDNPTFSLGLTALAAVLRDRGDADAAESMIQRAVRSTSPSSFLLDLHLLSAPIQRRVKAAFREYLPAP